MNIALKASAASRVGIGLRAPHLSEVLHTQPPMGWLEVHSENWMTDHGMIAEQLQDICRHYPLSLHGVGLSLGSVDGVDQAHLAKLKSLINRTNPILVSEHLSWGRYQGWHSNDLLPLPYTEAAVRCLVQQIDQVQQVLGRQLLVENLSSYCTFASSTMPEWDFVTEVVTRADCGVLLDINNIYVNSVNHHFDPMTYLAAMPWSRVAEIHLAGFDVEGDVLIDTHGRSVQPAVWQLYRAALPYISRSARVLIEWDTDLPELAVLLSQAEQARAYLQEYC